MSQCPHCFVGQCQRHKLQDHGRREAQLKAKMVDPKAAQRRLYDSIVTKQLDKLEAAARGTSESEQDKYKASISKQRDRAERKGNKLSTKKQAQAAESRLGGHLIRAMLSSEDEEDDRRKVGKKRKHREKSRKRVGSSSSDDSGNSSDTNPVESRDDRKRRRKDKKHRREKSRSIKGRNRVSTDDENGGSTSGSHSEEAESRGDRTQRRREKKRRKEKARDKDKDKGREKTRDKEKDRKRERKERRRAERKERSEGSRQKTKGHAVNTNGIPQYTDAESDTANERGPHDDRSEFGEHGPVEQEERIVLGVAEGTDLTRKKPDETSQMGVVAEDMSP